MRIARRPRQAADDPDHLSAAPAETPPRRYKDMKLALGLFHFNIAEVSGEISAPHRYCTQVVLPFLHAIKAEPSLRVTFEMAGSGLEFLAEHYPTAIDLLRDLVARRQIELVSSTYAPTLWVAFPWRDLEKSILLNRKVLEKLDLKAAPVFFAQEGFFGPGLEVVSDWFDVAVCRDTTLRYFSDPVNPAPAYKAGRLTVIVGANHLLNEIASAIIAETENGRNPSMSLAHEARVQEAVQSSFQSQSDCIEGESNGTAWHWYHVGSAHHFTTTGSPQNWENFFCDPEWMNVTAGALLRLSEHEFQPGSIMEFARQVERQQLQPLIRVIEADWSPKLTQGVYAWMGRHEHRWEAGSALLTVIWRARHAVRKLEWALDCLGQEPSQRFAPQMNEIWRQLILAESSGPFGGSTLPIDVNSGREQGDRVLQVCAALREQLPACPRASLRQPVRFGEAMPVTVEAVATSELLGGEGRIQWQRTSESLYICEVRLRSEDNLCGVRFKRETEGVTYCPSCAEHKPVTIPADEFPKGEFYLPLANGLISLSEKLHLIRENCTTAVAARVSSEDSWVRFATSGMAEGRVFEWRFHLHCGTLEDAVAAANRINDI